MFYNILNNSCHKLRTQFIATSCCLLLCDYWKVRRIIAIILKNVKKKLERKRGIIRYVGDKYYNKEGEAEWTMGFPWLAIIYRQLGDLENYKGYMKKTVDAMNSKNELPELYYSNSEEHNDNSPLGWAQSLYIVAAL